MRQILAGALLAVLVAALAWINLHDRQAPSHQDTANVDQQFSDFTATQFGHDGTAQWQLTGTTLEHLRHQAGYRIQQPAFRFHDSKQPGPPWTLTAPSGTADNDLTQLLLTGGVVGKRAAWGDHGQLNLHTERLTIKPKRRKAMSHTRTVFSETRPHQGGLTVWRSQSDGFTLDYDSQILQQSRVEDRLEPRFDASYTPPPHTRTAPATTKR